MANESKPKQAQPKKIEADYPVSDANKTLWGVDFTAEGEGEKARYVANVDGDTAESLISSGRAKPAK